MTSDFVPNRRESDIIHRSLSFSSFVLLIFAMMGMVGFHSDPFSTTTSFSPLVSCSLASSTIFTPSSAEVFLLFIPAPIATLFSSSAVTFAAAASVTTTSPQPSHFIIPQYQPTRYRPNGTVFRQGPPLQTEFKLCFFIFGDIDDFAYSYTKNTARLAAERALRAKYPTVDFTFKMHDQFAFGDRPQQLLAVVQDYSHFVMAVDPLDEAIIREVATQYPDKYFLCFNAFGYTNMPSNVIPYVLSYAEPYYVSGAIAATQSTNCVAMIPAFEEFFDPASSVNGLLNGIRSVNGTMPFHVMPLDVWYDATRETQAAEALYAATKCDVIYHYSDTRSTNLVAKKYNKFANGVHNDQATFLGDRTLTSVAYHWEAPFVRFVEEWLQNGAYDLDNYLLFGMDSGVASVTDVSPEASQAARDARDSALARLDAGGSAILYCNREIVSWDGIVQFSPTAAKPCADWHSVVNTNYFEKGIIRHPGFHGHDVCKAGAYANIVHSPLVRIECLSCPANTYSALDGQTQCTPCAGGYESGPHSTSCSKVPEVNLLAIILPIVGIIAVVGLAVFLVYGRVQFANRHAPRKGPLCIIFTDIENSTLLWERYPDAMQVAVQQHHATIRRLIDEHQGYEVKVVGDAFMVGFGSAMNGVLFAADVQRGLNAVDWPAEIAALGHSPYADPPTSDYEGEALFRGLRVRCGGHWCLDVSARYDGIHQRYDYYGPDVNVTARIEHSTYGGQVLVSAHLWEEACRDPSFEFAASTLDAEEWGSVDLKGVTSAYTLYDVQCRDLPRVFTTRRQGGGGGAVGKGVGDASRDDFGQVGSGDEFVKPSALLAVSHRRSLLGSSPTAAAGGGGCDAADGGSTSVVLVLEAEVVGSSGQNTGGSSEGRSTPRSVHSQQHAAAESGGATGSSNGLLTSAPSGSLAAALGPAVKGRPEIVVFQVLNAALNKLSPADRATFVKKLCDAHIVGGGGTAAAEVPSNPVAQLAALANAMKRCVTVVKVGGRHHGRHHRASSKTPSSGNNNNTNHNQGRHDGAGADSSHEASGSDCPPIVVFSGVGRNNSGVANVRQGQQQQPSGNADVGGGGGSHSAYLQVTSFHDETSPLDNSSGNAGTNTNATTTATHSGGGGLGGGDPLGNSPRDHSNRVRLADSPVSGRLSNVHRVDSGDFNAM